MNFESDSRPGKGKITDAMSKRLLDGLCSMLFTYFLLNHLTDTLCALVKQHNMLQPQTTAKVGLGQCLTFVLHSRTNTFGHSLAV